MEEKSPDKKLTKKEKRALKRKEKKQKREQEKKKKGVSKALGWIITLVVIAGVLWGILQVGKQTTPSVISNIPPSQIVATDHTQGASESAMLLVEYSDYECPACAQYNPMVNELLEQNGDDFTFVYRHFPLRQIHKNAQLASQAAEAAAKQGMFWQMHDVLFDNQDSWSDEDDPTDTFVDYAEELGIDTEQFKNDLNSQKVLDKVNNDFISGQAAGVNSTPTFYLNGEKLTNIRSVEDFQNAIEQTAPMIPENIEESEATDSSEQETPDIDISDLNIEELLQEEFPPTDNN